MLCNLLWTSSILFHAFSYPPKGNGIESLMLVLGAFIEQSVVKAADNTLCFPIIIGHFRFRYVSSIKVIS